MFKVEFEARRRGITQAQIAEHCKVNSSLINRVFRGAERPYPKLQSGIASAIGWPQERAAELFEEVRGCY